MFIYVIITLYLYFLYSYKVVQIQGVQYNLVSVFFCTAPKSPPAVPENVQLKRNEAYAAVSVVSLQTNEAYAVAFPLQMNEAYENPLLGVALQKNEAYGSVVRPANTMDIQQTYPEYEIEQ